MSQLTFDFNPDDDMPRENIVVVGEHPGINTRAKRIFDEAMEELGLDEYGWLDVLPDAPPEGKNVTKTMVTKAGPLVRKRLCKKNPRFVVLLGNTPCEAILDKKGINKLRGKPIEHGGRVVIPMLHPNSALYDEKYLDTIKGDIQRLKDCVDFGGIPEERELDYDIVDTWDKVKLMLKDLRGKVSIDGEMTRLYPFYTQLDELIASRRASKQAIADHKKYHSGNLPDIVSIQFGCRRRQWVLPMRAAGIWSEEKLDRIIRLVTRKLKECFCIYHNGKFDALWMLVHHGVKWRVDFDTMLAHYLLDENDRHGLKYLAQKFLGAPDWDIDGKDKQSWSPKNAKYAAHDVYYTRKLYFTLKRMLDEDHDVRQVFRYIMMPCVKLFTEAEHQGVYIEQDQMEDAENYLREELQKAEDALEKWAKKAELVDKKTGKLNWGSTTQLGDLLFRVLKIKPKPEWKNKTGYSVSESVLNQIDHPMVGDLLKYRGHKQQLSFFIDGWKPYLDLEGRLHPSFKLHGTVTGRLSCENPNLQQVPRDPRIRSLISAAPGWVLMEADLSQIELRLAADAADEHNLLAVFHGGGDPHWQTAIREIERGAGYSKEVRKTARLHSGRKMNYSEAIEYILQIGGDEAVATVEAWAETKGLAAFIDWKETRKKAKAINFGYLYGMWWKKFKLYARDNYGVTVTDDEAQASREAFFELYPAFEAWHEKQRRFAQMNGYVRSLSGRKRRLPAAESQRDTPQRREAQRQAINSPIQSFANELNLMAALQMRKEFKRSWFRLVGTVHDAVLVEVRADKVEYVYNRVLEIMSAPELLQTFDIELNVPIEAEAKIGAWSKGKGIKKWLEEQSQIAEQQDAKSKASRLRKKRQRELA